MPAKKGSTADLSESRQSNPTKRTKKGEQAPAAPRCASCGTELVPQNGERFTHECPGCKIRFLVSADGLEAVGKGV